MNTSHENQNSSQPDDHADRLVDIALAELVGGSVPPDFSSRIAAGRVRQPAALRQAPSTRGNRAFWVSLAAAVMLLVSVTVVTLPRIETLREASPGVVALRKGAVALRNVHDSQAAHQQVLLSDGLSASAPQPPDAVLSYTTNSGKDVIEVPGFQTRVDRLGALAQADDQGSPLSTAQPQPFGNNTHELEVRGKIAAANQLGTLNVNASGVHSGQKPEPTALYKAVAGTSDPKQQQSQLGRIAVHSGPAGPRDLRQLHPYGEFGLAKQGNGTLTSPNQSSARVKTSQEGTTFGWGFAGPEGSGPDVSGDQYTRIVENPFVKAEGGAAVSTFSIDVDTASYSNIRQFLMDSNQLPPPDAVRIEELVNYFQYDYAGPKSSDDAPFAAHVEVSACPWAPEHRLARIGIKGRELDRSKRPQSNLVFLVDVSGSMDEPNKLPLVVYGLEQLTRELGENDRVAIVVYASTEGLVLPSTRGDKQDAILASLAKLKAGGSTAGGAGIQLAYQLAEDHFIKGGTNRVILCTDGDFNVGVTSTAELERLVEKKAKDTGVFLSVLGFGRGNLNDSMMEAISNHGNGNYSYVDNRSESRRVLVEQMTGTLNTIAKDVKIQVEFNPAKVSGYRLIGYEDRMLRTEDFNDDKKDAGEIGAGHTVTALYEFVPAGKKVDVGPSDELKYQKRSTDPNNASDSRARVLLTDGEELSPERKAAAEARDHELLTLKMRYKSPDGETSKKLEWPATDDGKSFAAATPDLKFASAVAGFGLLLRNSQYKGNLTYGAVLELAQGNLGEDNHGYRKEFLDIVRKAKELRHE